MQARMLRLRHYLQILQSIIRFVVIYMMHNLVIAKPSSEVPLHYQSMLSFINTGPGVFHEISTWLFVDTTIPQWMLIARMGNAAACRRTVSLRSFAAYPR